MRDETFYDAVKWLQNQATRVANRSMLESNNGIRIFTPDGSGHYSALWTRDFYYLLEGCPFAVSRKHAIENFMYLISGQREDGAIPDRVQADGMAVYIPGLRQPLGNHPATDNPAFIVKMAKLLCDRVGDFRLFEINRDSLEKGLKFPPISPAGLIWIDPSDPHSSYGFYDRIVLTGEVFFSSVLQWDAYRDMAMMDQAIGLRESSIAWSTKADILRNSLQQFWDPKTGMFRAATNDCNQVDVWGSAYAVYTGLTDANQADRIGDYLITRHNGLMQKGQLRHCSPGEYWQRALTPKDTYQNGGHWATPFGWWFVAVQRIDPHLAIKTFLELVKDFQIRGIHEWILGDILAVRDYVASPAQPLAGLRLCGYYSTVE
jgi:hypothetical protein